MNWSNWSIRSNGSNLTPSSENRLIALIAFVGGLGGGLVFPIFPSLGLKLGISGLMIGLILAANRIARLIFNIPAGHLIDRAGSRFTLATALVIETCGMLFFSAALKSGHPEWWLLSGRALYGVGTAFLMVGAQAAALGLSDRSDRGEKTALVRVAIGTGIPAGLVLGGVVADLFSENAAFLSGAAITFVGAILAIILLPSRKMAASNDGRKTEYEGLEALFKSSDLPLLAGAWSLNFMVFFAIHGVLLSTLVILVSQRGISMAGMASQGTSGLIMAVMIGSAAVSSFPLGRRLDRLPHRTSMLIPSLFGLALSFLILAMSSSLWFALIASVITGVAFNTINLSIMALLGDSGRQGQHGPVVGAFQFFGDIGGTLGPIMGIEAAARFGIRPLYLCLAAIPALAILLALWMWTRERNEITGTERCIG